MNRKNVNEVSIQSRSTLAIAPTEPHERVIAVIKLTFFDSEEKLVAETSVEMDDDSQTIAQPQSNRRICVSKIRYRCTRKVDRYQL